MSLGTTDLQEGHVLQAKGQVVTVSLQLNYAGYGKKFMFETEQCKCTCDLSDKSSLPEKLGPDSREKPYFEGWHLHNLVNSHVIIDSVQGRPIHGCGLVEPNLNPSLGSKKPNRISNVSLVVT